MSTVHFVITGRHSVGTPASVFVVGASGTGVSTTWRRTAPPLTWACVTPAGSGKQTPSNATPDSASVFDTGDGVSTPAYVTLPFSSTVNVGETAPLPSCLPNRSSQPPVLFSVTVTANR